MGSPWMLSGTYFEACNCDTACPCVFLSDPTTGDCNLLVAWHIERGNYGDVELEGLNVAVAVHSPANMTQGNWRVAVYFDERASEGQQQALAQIFTGQAGGHPAVLRSFMTEVLGVANVPIEYREDGRRRSLRIAGIASSEIEAIEGQGGADVLLENVPLCIVPGHPSVVAKSTTLRYEDHGLSWEISGKNGFYSPFTYQGE